MRRVLIFNNEKILVMITPLYGRRKGEFMSGFNNCNEKSFKVRFNTN